MTAQAHTAKSVLRELIPAVQAYLMTGDAMAQAAKRRVWEPVLKRAASLSDPVAADTDLLDALIELRDASQHDETEQFLAAIAKADAAIAFATGEAEPWQVKDFADGWIDVPDKDAAERLSAKQSGAAIRPKPVGGEAGT